MNLVIMRRMAPFLVALAPFAIVACSSEEPANSLNGSPNGVIETNEEGEPIDEGATPAASTPAAPGETAPTPAAPGETETTPTPTPAGENKNLGNSAGCGNAAAGKGFQTRSMTINGKARKYTRFIPNGYDPNKPVALVLAFHGSGGTSEASRSVYDLEAESGNKAIYLYPEALPNKDFENKNRWDPNKGSDDYAFVDAIQAEIEKSHCVDRDRVFAVGFSLGARFTAMLGCYRGDKLRAIAPVAPGGDEQTLPLTGCVGEVAVWEGLGTQDDELHTVGANRVREHYRVANGCGTTRKATLPNGCEAYEGCREGLPTVWCTYNLGHKWPGIGSAGVWGFFDALK